MRIRPSRAVVAAVCAAAVIGGCLARRRLYRCPVGYYAEPGDRLHQLGRVVFIPLANEADHPGPFAGMTEALFQAIQCRGLFHLELAPPELAETAIAVNGRAVTLRQLAALRQVLESDAVLIGAVNHFRPYPHMQMGLYLRLLDLRDGGLLWSVDHVWDATTKDTEERLQIFYLSQAGERTDPLGWRMATVSPRAFQRFVAWEVAQTLPEAPAERAAGAQAAPVHQASAGPAE